MDPDSAEATIRQRKQAIDGLYRKRWGVDMWGRLRSGIPVKAVEEELRLLAAELRKQQPDAIWENETLAASPGGYAQNAGGANRCNKPAPGLRGTAGPILAIMGTLVFLIFAVASSNLGSLLLARGVARQREMSIRASVGAGRARLIRQLLTESLVLALLGSAAGFALGYVVLRLMMVWNAAPAWLDPTPDVHVVLFAIAIGFAASLLFGLAPALQVTRPNVRSSNRVRHVLITAQVASSCVLLIVAGLLVRALHHVIATNPGFEYEQVVAIEPRLQAHGYSSASARAYIDTLTSRLRSTPGIESVSVTATPPLGNRQTTASLDRPGLPSISVSMHRVDPQFFETMKIPLLAGRNLLPGEQGSIIVSDSFAKLRWPGENPLDQKLSLDDRNLTVVGIAMSAHLVEPQNSDALELYRPLDPATDLVSAAVLVKMSGPPEGFAPYVVSIAKGIDDSLVPEVETLKGAFGRKLESTQRMVAGVSVLGTVALLLACLGIAGTIAYAVSQRTKEIGIRVALGASPVDVASSMLRKFVVPVVVGLVIGTGGAAMLSQYLRNQLYGLSNLDPIAYISAIGLFVAAAIVAAYFPVRRALRVDPLLALRAD